MALLSVIIARDPRAGVRASIACARRAFAGVNDPHANELLAGCERWIAGGSDEGLSEASHDCEVSASETEEPARSARILAATVASVVDLLPFVEGCPRHAVVDFRLRIGRYLPVRSWVRFARGGAR